MFSVLSLDTTLWLYRSISRVMIIWKNYASFFYGEKMIMKKRRKLSLLGMRSPDHRHNTLWEASIGPEDEVCLSNHWRERHMMGVDLPELHSGSPQVWTTGEAEKELGCRESHSIGDSIADQELAYCSRSTERLECWHQQLKILSHGGCKSLGHLYGSAYSPIWDCYMAKRQWGEDAPYLSGESRS